MIGLTSMLALATLFSTYVLGIVALFFRITRMPLKNFLVAKEFEPRAKHYSNNAKMQNCFEDKC